MNHLTFHKHRESSYLRAYKAPLHLSRMFYKSPIFMQNKPNLLNAKMNVNKVLTKDYENQPSCGRRQNKPNLLNTQIKAGEGNRTLVTSLEGWSFTTKLHPRLQLAIDS